MSSLSSKERRLRLALMRSFTAYAERCLKIRTKEGGVEPLKLNIPQQRLHEAIEDQKRRTGRVRMLVPKGRQLGVSTYIGGRFYHIVTHGRGLRAFILTHRDQATASLFEMAKRFHENCPQIMRPQIKASNAAELLFGRLDSGYKVATAKAQGVGRGETLQLFHGSEVAFWQNAGDHATGALQAVPDAPGTEIILESTGNGIGGLFYAYCQRAIQGIGGWEVCFLPWFWHDEYQTEPPGGWLCPDEWQRYADLHGLTRAQVYWAYLKNIALSEKTDADPDVPGWRFRQEYPATLDEAFQLAADGSFINPDHVLAARRTQLEPDPYAPLLIGLDVALGGGNKTWMISRKGRILGRHLNEQIDSRDSMFIAGEVARMMERLKPDRVFIDVGGGYGSGVHDRLVERGYGAHVTAVQFGSKSREPRDYANKRAEIWGNLREWLADPGGADIPDDEELATHLIAPGFKLNSNDQILLESKEKIKERLGLSPDGGDAAALTFAEHVARYEEAPPVGSWSRGWSSPGGQQEDWEPEMVGA